MKSDLQLQITQMNTDEPAAEKHLRLSAPSAAKKEIPPKISVIVPVYKVEKYLPECIESVLAQTFTDFELILVDDGSPDNSGAICDAYAKKDSRIRVFHKENGGVSSARNLGLDHARGEWVMFVDSDDTVDRNICEVLLKHVEMFGVDFVYCRFWLDSGKRSREVSQGAGGIFGAEELLVGLMDGSGCGGGPYCKLFRSCIITENSLRFSEEISIFEDLLFVCQYIKKIPRGVSIPIAFYHYLQHEESAMHRISARLSRDRIRAMQLLTLEIDGNMMLQRILDRRKNGVKFAVIRSRALPRSEILNAFPNLSPRGMPFLKQIVLRLYPTPFGGVCIAALKIYEFFNTR